MCQFAKQQQLGVLSRMAYAQYCTSTAFALGLLRQLLPMLPTNSHPAILPIAVHLTPAIAWAGPR